MFDIIVIGGGAAGMTAALNCLRSGKTVLILEKENFGGQIANSPRVENFPTIKEISGEQLSSNLFDQVISLGCEFELEEVLSVTKDNNIFTVKTNYNEHTCRSVILATGLHHRKINVAREDELAGKGISYCAVCDGAFYANQDVAIIGDANTALQYALLLSNYCSKVYVCTLFDKFFADHILVDRLLKRENVVVTKEISLKELVGDNKLEQVVFENTKTKEIVKFDVAACFIAIGQIPDNNRYSNVVELTNNGYIITDNDLHTKTPGLFACGDCRNKKIRQLTTATADGAIAAIESVTYIDSL